MPSDSYMELSSLSVVGESGDQAWGGGTAYGMFEIANFSYDLGETSVKKDKDKNAKDPKKPTAPPKKMAVDDVDGSNKITIKKSLDYASPDLFLRCCRARFAQPEDDDQGVIAWAVIYFRESGEESKNPYLQLEFRELQVVSFQWDLDPAEGGEGAGKVETIIFRFETMMIKYSKQLSTGLHLPLNSCSWNFPRPTEVVQEIGQDPADTQPDK